MIPLIQGQASDSDTDNKPKKILKPNECILPQIELAPNVNIEGKIKQAQEIKMPSEFPEKQRTKSHLTGNVDKYYVNDHVFQEQLLNFEKQGFALDPQNKEYVLNENIVKKIDEKSPHIIQATVFGLPSKEENKQKKQLAKKRKKEWNPGSGGQLGPWAGQEGEDEKLTQSTEFTEDQQKILDKIEERRKKKFEEKKEEEDAKPIEAKAILHEEQNTDQQGRSWVEAPSNLKQVDHNCQIPKKEIHYWAGPNGHAKSVQAIRFFPKSGHLLLSCSLDTKVKLWDVNKSRKCIQTQMGHSEAVRDITFTNDGFHFLSAGFDRVIHYWDTETGKTILTIPLKKLPFCVRFNPDEEKQQAFLMGSANKKIAQQDTRTGEKVLSYDEHLAPINTVTFFENGKKFASTADDKKVFIWEFGTPVVIKHLTEPDMHAITATALHPSNKYFAGQSSDNKIVIYDSKGGTFRLNRKKLFRGHICAGYAIAICFSPDGQFLASGDTDGRVFFWDWKTTKNFRTLKAHESICFGVEWHPIEPSKFATCGKDGIIKFWD